MFRSQPFKPKAYHSGLDDLAERVSPKKFIRKIGSLEHGTSAELPEMDSKVEEEVEEVKFVTKTTGRIKFEGMIADDEAPTTIICEECETVYATTCCEICDQVFCSKCASLTHISEDLDNPLHEHERPTLANPDGFVRPLKYGDKSRVELKNPFHLPLGVFTEEDMMLRKDENAVDITSSNTLSLAQGREEPSKAVFSTPKFKVGDQLVFDDPATGEESYGRVVSEWDFRHGVVAPPIIRGENTGVMYIIDIIGTVQSVSGYAALVRKPPPAGKLNSFPEIRSETGEKVGDMAHREELAISRDINRKLFEMQEYNLYGPRFHMKANFPPLLAVEEDGRVDRTVSQPSLPPGGIADVIAKVEADKKPSSPRAAVLRRYWNVVGDYDANARRGVKLTVLPEYALATPIEKEIGVVNAKRDFLRRVVQKYLQAQWNEATGAAMSAWVGMMETLRRNQIYRAARVIQSLARMWLIRDVMRQKYDEWEAVLQERWRKVHGQFAFTTADDPYAITIDNKMYFATAKDCNRYASALRLETGRVFNYVGRKRMRLLGWYFGRWHKETASTGLSEKDISSSHLMEFADDTATGNQSPLAWQQEAAKSFARIKKVYSLDDDTASSTGRNKAKMNMHSALNELSYESIALMPRGVALGVGIDGNYGKGIRSDNNMENGMGMATEEHGLYLDPSLPPWHPSIGCDLPKLPKLHQPTTPEGLLNNSDNARLSYHAFRGHTEGPTDDSCWIVPGRICMGKFPHGLANRDSGTQQQAIPALMLAGLDIFVSLMMPDEEAEFVKAHQLEPMTSIMKKSAISAKFNVGQLVMQCDNTVLIQQEEINNMPKLEKTDIKFAKAKRERLRCQARIDLAKDTKDRALKQLKAYPENFRVVNVALEHHKVPTLNEFLPYIWEIERLYRAGHNLFFYSLEGHGRVGMATAALVGRLYGLNSGDMLYRIQACHDVTKRNTWHKAETGIHTNCPQLWQQSRLVSELLDACNRHFQGVNWRTRTNPEEFVDHLHQRARGVEGGLVSEMLDFRSTRAQPTVSKKSVIRAIEDASARDAAQLKISNARGGNRREKDVTGTETAPLLLSLEGERDDLGESEDSSAPPSQQQQQRQRQQQREAGRSRSPSPLPRGCPSPPTLPRIRPGIGATASDSNSVSVSVARPEVPPHRRAKPTLGDPYPMVMPVEEGELPVVRILPSTGANFPLLRSKVSQAEKKK
jgi:hypothetical protein